MLESAGRREVGAMVGLGLFALVAGRLPHLGLVWRTGCPHTLVARLRTLVSQYLMAGLPGLPVGQP